MLIKACDCKSCHLILAQGSGEQLKNLIADGYTFFSHRLRVLLHDVPYGRAAEIATLQQESRNAQCRFLLFDSE